MPQVDDRSRILAGQVQRNKWESSSTGTIVRLAADEIPAVYLLAHGIRICIHPIADATAAVA